MVVTGVQKRKLKCASIFHAFAMPNLLLAHWPKQGPLGVGALTKYVDRVLMQLICHTFLKSVISSHISYVITFYSCYD